MDVLAFTGYGGDVIKTFKTSPDAFVQMALQLGVFKMTGQYSIKRWTDGKRNCIHWVICFVDRGLASRARIMQGQTIVSSYAMVSSHA